MVFHADRNVVSRPKAGIAQDVGELDCSLVKLPVRRHLARLCLDHCGKVGLGLSKYTWVHGHKLVNDQGHSRLGKQLDPGVENLAIGVVISGARGKQFSLDKKGAHDECC